jgi:sugar-specific transcriptional regulator TrmB
MEGAAMIQNDDCIQTLMGFGLTLLQAKMYLALATLGKAEVKTIAKASNVARQDIYRIVPMLQKLGLAEKIIANPTMYKATPIEKGLSILLQNKKKECTELQEKTTSLINSFHANTAKIDAQEEDTQFKLTSEATLFLKMHKSLHQKAQMNIDAIIPSIFDGPVKFNEGLSFPKKAMRRGIKIRLITQKDENGLKSRELQALGENSLCELKYLATPVLFGMHIFDNKEVTLATSDNGLPSLWSNNRNLVNLAASYFDEMWSKAQEASNPEQKQEAADCKP